MYLILAPEDRRIVVMSEDLAYQENGNYLLCGGELAVPPAICILAQAETVPDGVEPETWIYTEAGQFQENPVEPEEEPEDPEVSEALAILHGEVIA